MELGVLKGPVELLASKVKAFKNCLDLATECLTNKDYMNAEMIYGGILADVHKDCIVEALGLNDLELFSVYSCFAYSSIAAGYKFEQALVILDEIHKPIELPLVPYLKAFVHISNDRYLSYKMCLRQMILFFIIDYRTLTTNCNVVRCFSTTGTTSSPTVF